MVMHVSWSKSVEAIDFAPAAPERTFRLHDAQSSERRPSGNNGWLGEKLGYPYRRPAPGTEA
ncbi:hypothetical protein [Kitasatospora sp. NPDC057541]|uniref:hypothetical protein n=1 Tax=unclassified Kitasatospora TaxID=2633591 RepID=UPI003674B71F